MKCGKAIGVGYQMLQFVYHLELNCSYLMLIVLPFSIFCSCDCHSYLLFNGKVHTGHLSSILKLLMSVYVCILQKIAVECCQDKLISGLVWKCSEIRD